MVAAPGRAGLLLGHGDSFSRSSRRPWLCRGQAARVNHGDPTALPALLGEATNERDELAAGEPAHLRRARARGLLVAAADAGGDPPGRRTRSLNGYKALVVDRARFPSDMGRSTGRSARWPTDPPQHPAARLHGPGVISELARPFGITLPTVLEHVRILEERVMRLADRLLS